MGTDNGKSLKYIPRISLHNLTIFDGSKFLIFLWHIQYDIITFVVIAFGAKFILYFFREYIRKSWKKFFPTVNSKIIREKIESRIIFFMKIRMNFYKILQIFTLVIFIHWNLLRFVHYFFVTAIAVMTLKIRNWNYGIYLPTGKTKHLFSSLWHQRFQYDCHKILKSTFLIKV